MRAIICDICGALDRSGYTSSTINYSYKINGIFYPEELCDNCTNMLVQTLNLARQQAADEAKKKQELPPEPQKPLEEDNNPATA